MVHIKYLALYCLKQCCHGCIEMRSLIFLKVISDHTTLPKDFTAVERAGKGLLTAH